MEMHRSRHEPRKRKTKLDSQVIHRRNNVFSVTYIDIVRCQVMCVFHLNNMSKNKAHIHSDVKKSEFM